MSATKLIATEDWLDQNLQNHERLTQAVVAIVENLLKANNIDYLAVSGRTKTKQGALDKIKRKGYKNPIDQLTDLSGIRIIVYFETDVGKVSKIIETSFEVDKNNSLNKDDLLSTDQLGYRSAHYVCDLGEKRSTLPEFNRLSGLRFEFQVRTALQHAWAELAHDRNYKFSGKLPREIERRLYLYAGMLEIADKGFDEISNQIDAYIDSLQERAAQGDLSSEINSISLVKFVEDWSKENDYPLEEPYTKNFYEDLVNELKEFGVSTLSELKAIEPQNYAKLSKEMGCATNIYGVTRDWMLIHDWRRFIRDVHFDWRMSEPDIIKKYLNREEFREFRESIIWDDDVDDVDDVG
jgi:ppGpp synthetase/RelA/SpoT-type nucleotidyltranferase